MYSFLYLDVELSDGHCVVLELVHIARHVLTLHLEQNEGGVRRTVEPAVSTSYRARVHEVATVVLLHASLVRVSRHENIAVELTLDCRESLDIAPRDHVVAMGDTDPEPTDLDHFVLGECGVGVKIALCDVCLSPDRG